MSTFFEIFNKVLLELNYRTVTEFEDIYKSEHIKILDAINRVNDEVLSSFEWPFLLRSEALHPENEGGKGDTGQEQSQISTILSSNSGGECSQISTIESEGLNEGGQISTIFPCPLNNSCIPLIPHISGVIKSVYQGDKKLLYFPNLENALQKGLPANSYTILSAQSPPNTANSQLTANTTKSQDPENPEDTATTPNASNSQTGAENNPDKTLSTGNFGVQILVNPGNKGPITVYYYSKHTCLGADGTFKTKMDAGGDVSILPMPYAEHILLYGTCLKAKANPAYPKFGFWNTMYIQALANLQKKGASAAEDTPFLSIS